MQAHRFRELVDGKPLMDASVPPVQSSGFMACPLLIAQAMQGGIPLWQMAIYQLAFEQAQAAQQPPHSHRDLLPSLN
jgi:hypothetical protein